MAPSAISPEPETMSIPVVKKVIQTEAKEPQIIPSPVPDILRCVIQISGFCSPWTRDVPP
jgi:hypothetical protein